MGFFGLEDVFGNSQNVKQKQYLPFFIEEPSKQIGYRLADIFKYGNPPPSGLGAIERDALHEMEDVAWEGFGSGFGNAATGALRDIWGTGGLTADARGLAGQLTSGQIANPALGAAGALAGGAWSGGDPAMGRVGQYASGGMAGRNPAQGMFADTAAGREMGLNPTLGTVRGIGRGQEMGMNPVAGAVGAIGRGEDMGWNPAAGAIGHIAGGGDVGGNPFLDAMYGNAARQVGKQFRETVVPGLDAEARAAGRTGSGTYAHLRNNAEDALGRNLSEMAAGMYGQAYETDRGRQMQALAQQSQMYGEDRARQMQALGMGSQIYGEDQARRMAALGMETAAYEQDRARQQAAQQALSGIYGEDQARQLQALGMQSQAHEADMARQLAGLQLQGQLGQQDIANRLQGAGLYDTGLNRVLQGVGLGGAANQLRYDDLNKLFEIGQSRTMAPFAYLNQAAGVAGALQGGAGTEQKLKSSALGDIMGTAAGAAGIAAMLGLSDRRLKTDAAVVGALPSGLPVWRYRYLWDEPGTVRVGVMAQEALAVVPEAVVEGPGGFLAVDYSMVR